MTKQQTVLETMWHDAQRLHKKIGAHVAEAKTATWDDVLIVQGEAQALASDMKAIAEQQAGDAKTGLTSAIATLEDATKRVESKSEAGKGHIKHANAAMLQGVHKANHALSLPSPRCARRRRGTSSLRGCQHDQLHSDHIFV